MHNNHDAWKQGQLFAANDYEGPLSNTPSVSSSFDEDEWIQLYNSQVYYHRALIKLAAPEQLILEHTEWLREFRRYCEENKAFRHKIKADRRRHIDEEYKQRQYHLAYIAADGRCSVHPHERLRIDLDIRGPLDPLAYEMDHINPLWQSDDTSYPNIQVVCRAWHWQKSAVETKARIRKEHFPSEKWDMRSERFKAWAQIKEVQRLERVARQRGHRPDAA